MRRFRSLAGALALLLVAVSPALAQTNDDIFAGLQFSFMPPGARALAIGGAFVGRADDATAAYSNPAGLLWLEQPEVSVEVRHSSFTTPYVDGGRQTGEPTFRGIDVLSEPRYSDYESDTTGISFLSYAYANPDRKWAFAVYRHELANFEVSIESQASFRHLRGRERQSGSMIGELDLLIENFGFSGAYPVLDSLWVGVGISYYRIDVLGLTRRFEIETMFEPARFTPASNFINRRLTGVDADVAFIGGLLWRSKNRRWSAGAVYRQGPKFDVFTELTWGPFAIESGRADTGLAASRTGRTNFHVPDVLGVGFSVRIVDNFTASFEYDRVSYSNLEPEMNVLTRGGLENTIEFERFFVVDDGDEFHLGLEYVILSSMVPLVLRAGAWTDPDHQIRYEPVPPDPEDHFTFRYRPGDDIVHITGGIGVVLMEGRVQVLDLAASASDRVDIFTFSTVVTF